MAYVIREIISRPNDRVRLYCPRADDNEYIVKTYEQTGIKTCPCGERFEESHHPEPRATSPKLWEKLGTPWPADVVDQYELESITIFTSKQAYNDFINDPIVARVEEERRQWYKRWGIKMISEGFEDKSYTL